LKTAARYAKFQNWKLASDVWNKGAQSSDPKAARRASYNMALAAEVAGDLDLAIQWAERAAQLGDRRAPRYVQILQQRKWEAERLKQQMDGKK
jgi:TPR repeat protein